MQFNYKLLGIVKNRYINMLNSLEESDNFDKC